MTMISVFFLLFVLNQNADGRFPIFSRQAGPECRRWGQVIDKAMEQSRLKIGGKGGMRKVGLSEF